MIRQRNREQMTDEAKSAGGATASMAHHVMRSRLLRVVLMATAMVFLAGCGSGGDGSEVAGVNVATTPEPTGSTTDGGAAEAVEQDAEPTATPTPNPTAVPEPTEVPEPTAAPEPTPIPDDGTPALESAYETPPVDGGWRVAAGTWASSSFSTPIKFNLPVDATLLTDGLGRLEFRVGSAESPQGWIHIVEPTAINRPAGPIPIDLVEADAAFADSNLLSETDFDASLGPATSYDFVMETTPVFEQFLHGCFRRPGLWCIEPFRTESGDQVSLAMDRVHRLSAVDFGEDGRLYVAASPIDDADQAFLELATTITSSIELSGVSWEGTRSLDVLGKDSIVVPAGRWVRSIGSTLLTIETLTDLPIGAVWFPEADVVGAQAGGASMYLTHLNLDLDPETALLPIDAAPWQPATPEEYGATIVDAGGTFVATDTSFAGQPAIEYDIVLEDADPCPQLVIPLPADATCATWIRSLRSNIFLFETEAIPQRVRYLQELGLVVTSASDASDPDAPALLSDLEAAIRLESMG